VAPLGVRERHLLDQAAHLARVVMENGGLEVLALRGRLPELAAQPAEEAHSRLVRHRG
jgi:hypothetical protein